MVRFNIESVDIRFFNKKQQHDVCGYHSFWRRLIGKMASIPLECPSSYWIAGPTSSGKTYFIRRMIKNKDEMFKLKPVAVHYCYKEWQPKLFGEMQAEEEVQFHEGLPSVDSIKEWSREVGGKHMFLILDDLQHEVCKDPEMASLFSVVSHHCCISLAFVVQNIYAQGRFSRDCALNCHYLVLFNSKRDRLQVSTLGRQLCPGKNAFFLSAYEDAVGSRNYQYLLVDLHPSTPRDFMLRTNIFPDDDDLTWVYTPK